MTAAEEAETLTIDPADLTMAEVAKELRCNHDTALRYLHQGVKVRGLPAPVKLKCYRLGGRYLVKRGDLKAFIDAQNPGRSAELAGEAKRRQQRADAAQKKLRKMLGKD